MKLFKPVLLVALLGTLAVATYALLSAFNVDPPMVGVVLVLRTAHVAVQSGVQQQAPISLTGDATAMTAPVQTASRSGAAPPRPTMPASTGPAIVIDASPRPPRTSVPSVEDGGADAAANVN
jgi:hypothetical protein